jgi:transmembrane sensor
VESGVVRVDDATGTASVVLEAGQVADVAPGAGVRRPAAPATDGFAWQHGTLVFDNASLQEIADGLSRYRRTPVRALVEGEQRLTAVVQSTDIEGFLQSLPSVAPVAVEDGSGETLIVPR